MLATTKTCGGGKNVGIGGGHLDLHLVLGPVARQNFDHMVREWPEIYYLISLPGQGPTLGMFTWAEHTCS